MENSSWLIVLCDFVPKPVSREWRFSSLYPLELSWGWSGGTKAGAFGMGNCYYIQLAPATRESSQSDDDCFQREKEERLQDPYLFHTPDHYDIPLCDSTFWWLKLEPKESSLGIVPSLGPCCILLLGWHNAISKESEKSSVSYPLLMLHAELQCGSGFVQQRPRNRYKHSHIWSWSRFIDWCSCCASCSLWKSENRFLQSIQTTLLTSCVCSLHGIAFSKCLQFCLLS